MSDAAAAVRLFVALGLPPEALSALEEFAEQAADPAVWRRIPAANLHLTLVFLGRRPQSAVEEVVEVLAAAAGPAPRVRLGEALVLPPRRPRTLGAAILEPDGGELSALQGRLAAGLAERGLHEPERRPFRAHVTVARLRAGVSPPRRAPAASPAPVGFRLGEVLLLRSDLRPSGAVYTPLARVSLD